ncbi:MAG TPA: glycoside hydrolase domain-containing protein [Chitinophagaceae bacterium]|nr:glycoside hydrolase domain-containing protein [Chitinophagaceae bacterium]
MRYIGNLLLTTGIASIAFVFCNGAATKSNKKESLKPASVAQSLANLNERPVETKKKAISGIVTFASSNKRYDANDTPDKQQLELQETGWKGERINCQLLIWANEDINNVTLKASDFTGPGNSTFSAGALTYGFIKYVGANRSGGVCGKIPDMPRIDVPDAISPQKSIDVAAKKLQPVWISISIPRNTVTGTYTSKISLSAGGSNTFDDLTLRIRVNKRTLPPPTQWEFFLDISQFPLSEARYYKLKPWSNEHFARIKPAMQRLANAGQKVVTTSFFWDPFSSKTANWGEENLMIRIQRNNGKMTYDFTNFDKWVNFMFSLGINKQISVFGLYPFNNNFEYFYKDVGANGGANARVQTQQKTFALMSKDYTDFWADMLRAFAKHLKEKGWMDKTVLMFDERPAKETNQIIKFAKSIDPSFRFGYGGGYHPEIMDDIDYFSIASYLIIPADKLKQRESVGKVTAFYTCCVEKQPNLFTYSSPAEGVFMGWYAYANNYDGYQRYALDQWSPVSLTDTRHPLVPAGDNVIIYPEDYTSVRFEKLVEGIQDFEKLLVLQKELSGEKASRLQAILIKFQRTNVKSIDDYKALVELAQSYINSL